MCVLKYKSAGNVCIEEKGQGADESVAVARGPETDPEQYEQVDPRQLNCTLKFLFHESAVSKGISKSPRGKALFNRVQPKEGRFRGIPLSKRRSQTAAAFDASPAVAGRLTSCP